MIALKNCDFIEAKTKILNGEPITDATLNKFDILFPLFYLFGNKILLNYNQSNDEI